MPFLERHDTLQSITSAVTVATTSAAKRLRSSKHDNTENVSQNFVVVFEIDASGGTSPTVDAKLQTSYDGTNWIDVCSMTQLVGAGSRRQQVVADLVGPWVRSIITPGGSAAPNTTGRIRLASSAGFSLAAS